MLDLLYTILIIIFVPIFAIFGHIWKGDIDTKFLGYHIYIKNEDIDIKVLLHKAYLNILNLNGVNIDGIRRLRYIT